MSNRGSFGAHIDVALDEFVKSEPLHVNLLRGRISSDSTVEDHGELTQDYHTEIQREVRCVIHNETPRHRLVVSLYLQGFEFQEIAERTGFGAGYCSTILKQPWAREFMAKMQNMTTAQRVMVLLDGAAAPALTRLITEMDNMKARSSERTVAADKVLDRLFGKAVQPIVHSQVNDPSKMSDAEIERRLSELKATKDSRS